MHSEPLAAWLRSNCEFPAGAKRVTNSPELIPCCLVRNHPMLLHLDHVTSTRRKVLFRRHAARGLAHGASVVCAALAVLVACSTDQPSGPADAEVQAFAARGYGSAKHSVAGTTTHAWSVSGQALSVVMSLPDETSAAPLVIYLPGLGQSSEAGELWRTAWSSAGYAVLSVQLLEADERACRRLSRAAENSGSLRSIAMARPPCASGCGCSLTSWQRGSVVRCRVSLRGTASIGTAWRSLDTMSAPTQRWSPRENNWSAWKTVRRAEDPRRDRAQPLLESRSRFDRQPLSRHPDPCAFSDQHRR